MRLKSWFLGMVRRFRLGGFIPRFLRPFRPRSAVATIRGCFRRRRQGGALPGTMQGNTAEARARKARRQKIRNAVRFSPRIGTLEPRVMLDANDHVSTAWHESHTFQTTGGAADVLQISSVNEGGHQWGVISSLSGPTVTVLQRFRGYETVVIETGAGADSVTLSSSFNADGLKSLQINTGLGDDTVNLSAVNPSSALKITYEGGAGSDSLIGFNQPSVWKVNAAGGGSLGSASYANVETVDLRGQFGFWPALGNPASLSGDALIQARTDIHATTLAMNEGLAALTGQTSDLKNAFDGNRFLNVKLPLVDTSLNSVLQPGTTMQSVLGAGQAVGDYLSQHDTAFDLLTITGPSGAVVVGARDSSGVTTYATFDATTTPAQIQTALQSLPAIGSGNVTVTGSAGVFRIERAAGNLKALPPLALAVEADATLTQVVAPTGAQYTLGITGVAGVYVLQSGANRVTLPFDATAATVQTALRTLTGRVDVTVTPVVGSARSFTVAVATDSTLPVITVVEAADATLKLDAIDAVYPAPSTPFPTLAGMAGALKSALDQRIQAENSPTVTTTVAAILDGVNHSLSFEIQVTRSKTVNFNVALGAGLADLGLDLGALPPGAPQFEATVALSIDVGFGVSLATLAGPRTGTPVTPGTLSPIVAGSRVPFPRASDFSVDVKKVEASATAALSNVNLPLVPTSGNTGSGLGIFGGQASLTGKVDVAFGDATDPGHVGFGGIQSLASQATFNPTATFAMALPVVGRLVTPNLTLDGTMTISVPEYDIFSGAPRSFAVKNLQNVAVKDAAAASLAETVDLTITGSTGPVVITDGSAGVAIPVGATAEDVRAALESLKSIGTGNVSATAVVGTPGRFTLAAKGTLASLPALSIAAASALAPALIGGRRDLQVPTGPGFFVITDGTDHAVLAASATADQVQTALAGFSSIGTGNVSVAKTFGIHAQGGLAAVPSLGVVATADLTGATLAAQSGSKRVLTPAGSTGLFVLGYTSQGQTDYVVIPADSTPFEIRQALAGIPAIGPGNVSVASAGGGFEVSKNGGTWNLASLSAVSTAGFAATDTAAFDSPTELTLRGATGIIVLTDKAGHVAMSAAASASDIETALENLPEVGPGNVSVAPPLFRIEPQGNLRALPPLRIAGTDEFALADATLAGNNLTVEGTSGSYVVTVTNTAGTFHVALPAGATAGAIKQALGEISAIGASNVSVSTTFGVQKDGSLSALPSLRVATAIDFTNANASLAGTQLTVAGTTGCFVLAHGADYAVLPATADAEAIAAALADLPSIGAGHVSVGTTFHLQAQGSLSQLPALIINPASAPAVLNAANNLTVTGTAGYYLLTDGTDVVAIPANANAFAIRRALQDLDSIGTGNVSVAEIASASGTRTFEIRKNGTLAKLPALRVAGAGDVARAQYDGSTKELTVQGTTGFYVVQAGTGYVAIPASADAFAVEAKLEALPGIGAGKLSVDPSVFTIALTGPGSSTPLRLVPASELAAATYSASGLVVSGHTGGSVVTDDQGWVFVAATADAMDIETALEGLPGIGIGKVSVAPPVYGISFSGLSPAPTLQLATSSQLVAATITAEDNLAFTGLASNGTSGFVVLSDGTDSVVVPAAGAKAIQAALERLPSIGAGKVVVTAVSAAAGAHFEIRGSSAAVELPSLSVVPVAQFAAATLARSARLVVGGTEDIADLAILATSGNVALTVGSTTVQIPASATAEQIKAKLEAEASQGGAGLGAGNVAVATVYGITGAPASLQTVSPGDLKTVAIRERLDLHVTASTGCYVLTNNSGSHVVALAHDADVAEVTTALEGFPGIGQGNVAVGKTYGLTFTTAANPPSFTILPASGLVGATLVQQSAATRRLTLAADTGFFVISDGADFAVISARATAYDIRLALQGLGSIGTNNVSVATATQMSPDTTYDDTDHDLTIVGSEPFVISDGIGHYAALPSTATAADIRSVLAGFAGPGAGTVSVQTAFDLSAAGALTTLPTLTKVAVLNAASFHAPNDLRVTGSTGVIVLTDGTDHALLPLPTSPAAITTSLEKFGRIGAGRVTVGQTYEISASAPLPAMQILNPADLTAATLVRQSAATRRLTLAANTGFFVISDGADFAVVPVTGTTATLKNAIRSALEGFDRIGAHVSVADVTTPDGSPTFEISKNGGSWKLPSLRIAAATDFAVARFDAANELTVTGSTGIYLVKSGSSVALLEATDNAAVIEGKLQSLVPTGGPQIDVAPPIFRIAAGGDLRSLPALRVVEAGDLADASYSDSQHRITVTGSTGIYVISDGQGYALLHASDSAAEIESALEWLPRIDGENVSVEPPVFHLAATGGLDAMLDSLEIVAPSALNTPPLTVSLTMHVGGTGDCFVLTDGTDAAVLLAGATALQIETALETFAGLTGVTVTGGVGGNFVISATGGISSLRSLRAVVAADFAAASLTGTGASRALTVEGATGLYVVKNSSGYALLHASDKASEIETALRTPPSGSSIDVDPGVFRIRAQGDLAALPLLDVADSTQGTIAITTGMASGNASSAYVLTDGTAIVPVNATADATAIKTAIETLPAFAGNTVSVTKNATGLFTIQVASGDLPALTVVRSAAATVQGKASDAAFTVVAPTTMAEAHLTGGVLTVVGETGSYVLKSGGNYVAIPATATAPAIQTAIQSLSGNSSAVVTTRHEIQPDGSLASLPALSIVPAADLQKATLTGARLVVTGSTGAYVLTDGGSQALLPVTATAEDIRTGLERFNGIGAGHVTVNSTYVLSASGGAMPQLQTVAPADLTAATLARQGSSSSMRLLTVTGTTGYFVVSYGNVSVAIQALGDTTALRIAIKNALEGIGLIGPNHVSVAVGTPSQGYPTFEISKNGGSWLLSSLRVAGASDFATATFDVANELTVSGSSGIYLVKLGANVAVLQATDNAATIRLKTQALITSGAPAIAVARPFFQIARSDGQALSPSLRVAGAGDLPSGLATFTNPSAPTAITIAGATGAYVVSDGTDFALLRATDGAATIEAALGTLGKIGAWNVSVAPPEYVITGASSSQPLAIAATSDFASATFSSSGLSVSGSGVYVMSDGAGFVAIPATADAAAIQAKLTQLPSVGAGGAIVTSTQAASGFTVTRQSASDTTLTVTGRSGAYVLTDDTHMAALAYDDTAADIQAALGAFTTTGTAVAVDKKASPLQYDLDLVGSVEIGGVFEASGRFHLSSRVGDLVRSDGRRFADAHYKVLSAEGVNVFVGDASGDRTGLAINDISFSVLVFTDTSGIADVTYTAMVASGGSASLVGVDGLELGVSDVTVAFNRTSDRANPNRVLDFGASGATAGIAIIPVVGPTIDLQGEVGSRL